ncbi:MAG: hypothetical protein FWH01_16035, partial [Oscillospiraceae bacterium]|nr:hypothetical protein [Oscillospiraceae bacterium]
ACNSLLQPQPHPQHLPQLPPPPPQPIPPIQQPQPHPQYLPQLPLQPPLPLLPTPPPSADYLLFDAPASPGQRGGGGRAFDWNVLKGYSGAPFFLAGGLTACTVADAVRTLSPYCVDVSSGVETNGRKDADKIMHFVSTVRGLDI